MKGLIPGEYAELLQDIKGRVDSARYAARKAVNREMIALYWDKGAAAYIGADRVLLREEW